jgi:hypothetical protein
MPVKTVTHFVTFASVVTLVTLASVVTLATLASVVSGMRKGCYLQKDS